MDGTSVRNLLTSLLDRDGVPWKEEAGLIRFLVRQGGMRWELNCRCRRDELIVYSRYPFSVPIEAAAWKLCCTINACLPRGAMLLPEDGRPVFRVWADMKDIYNGEAFVREALSFAARITARFWGEWEANANR